MNTTVYDFVREVTQNKKQSDHSDAATKDEEAEVGSNIFFSVIRKQKREN